MAALEIFLREALEFIEFEESDEARQLRFIQDFTRMPADGLRYTPHALCGVLVGGTRERRFDGINFKPQKLPDCPRGVRTPRSSSPTTTVLVLSRELGRLRPAECCRGARCVGCWMNLRLARFSKAS
jgi:hypothetical protein